MSPSKEGEEDNDDKSPCVQLEHLQIKNWKEENVFRERGSDFPPPVSLSSTILSFFLSRPVTVTRDTLRLSRLSLLLFPGGNQILVTLRFPLLREREEFHFFIIFCDPPPPSGVWPAMTSRFSLLSPKNMSLFKIRRRQRFPESRKKK